jgi:hypothetical protein
MDSIMKNQEEMMNRIVRLEKSQAQAPRPPFKGQFQKGNQTYKPKNENEVPNTLAPTNVVDENPWCLECSEAHWENECPYNASQQQVNNLDQIPFIYDDCLDLTLTHLTMVGGINGVP